MYDAFLHEKTSVDKFIWIDAGITQHISVNLIKDDIIDKMGSITHKVLFPSVDCISNDIHGFHYEGFKKYTDIHPDWLCRATIFGCNVNYIEKFKDEYGFYLKDSLSRGYMGTEESIFGLLSCIDSDTYSRYHCKGTSMPDIFLSEINKNIQI